MSNEKKMTYAQDGAINKGGKRGSVNQPTKNTKPITPSVPPKKNG